MTYLELRRDSLMRLIETDKKFIFLNLGSFLFNLSFAAWYFYQIFYGSYPKLYAACFGAFFSNSLWVLGSCLNMWNDLRSDKVKLKYIEQHEVTKYLLMDKELFDTYKKTLEEARQYKYAESLKTDNSKE